MKSKFFTLFAAFVLLFSANASAQVNGDVNEDGKVNEQDIAAILEIMAEAGGVKEQTKYYWYAGWTEPTAANIATIINEEYPTDETNTSKNHNHGNEPQKLHSFRSPFSQSTSRIQPSISGLPCQPM